MTDIGVGVLGCGGMGSHHASNLHQIQGIDVVAVSDTCASSAQSLASSLSARVLEPHQLIHDDAVDAIVVASPDNTHAEYAVAAIGANKPLLLEKPLADTVDQARLVVDAEAQVGRQLVQVGFMRELDPAHMELRSHLDSMGSITKIRCVHRNVDSQRRSDHQLFSQSIIHDIHTVRWLSGREFTNVATHLVERSDGFRDVLIVGRLDNGSLAQIEFEDQAFAYEVQVEVTTTSGMMATLPHPKTVRRSQLDESIRVGADWFGRFTDAYRAEAELWASSIRTQTPAGPTVNDGYRAQLVAEAAIRSLSSGSTEPVGETQ